MIKVAIIGAGNMGQAHAEAYQKIDNCELVAVCDTNSANLQNFASTYKLTKTFSSYNEMLADPEIDAISNVSSDKFHAPISIAALRAGKHVLCEKPLAITYKEASQMTVASEQVNKVNMINFSYRDCAAIHMAKDIVSSGELGEIIHVEASYLQSWLAANMWGVWRDEPTLLWRLSTEHGSLGVLGDVGIHLLDFVTYPLGELETLQCHLKTFANIKGKQFKNYRLDANDSAFIWLNFTNGSLGTLSLTRWATGHTNSITLGIYGSKGAVRIDLDKSPNAVELCSGAKIHKSEWSSLAAAPVANNYQRFIRAIAEGSSVQPDFARGAYMQKIIDCCLRSAKEQRFTAV